MVFADGASEGEDNTIGGLIVFAGAKTARYFAAQVPDELIAEWREELKHVVGLVELYAAVLARKTWHVHMSGRFCLHFIDNVPSQDSLVKGNSTSEIMRSLLMAYERLEKVMASRGRGLLESPRARILQTSHRSAASGSSLEGS